MTPEQRLRYQLLAEEPDYKKLARLGPRILPSLRKLIESQEVNVAAKATYLAGLVAGTKSLPVIQAATRGQPAIRAAAAAALRHVEQHPQSAVTLKRLLRDKDSGVRRLAVKSASAHATPAILNRLRRQASSDPAPAVRRQAKHSLAKAAKKPF